MYAGFPVFLISNRIAPAALKHLITKSGISCLFISEYDGVLKTNLKKVQDDMGIDLIVGRIPSVIDILSNKSQVQGPPLEKLDPESVCIVFHSSGITFLSSCTFAI